MNIRAKIKNFTEQRKAIRALQSLDDHALRDMGISRSQINHAVRGQ
ncbi:DUF1127 domain-containing protein [Rhizobium leguminosarum]|uniref:DUF1127 domain-containing protein n=1 Tax=Rhizobium leguminosarum TaxID=384 RepID=A0ACD5FCP7_RHILE|nr:DUF1127 domain-containing protein [Rhizobium leguminosarum]